METTHPPPEHLSEAVSLLEERGYRGAFRADPDGLRELTSGRLYRAGDLVVDDLFRFEGASDPDDESIVFALRDPAGEVRGTYTVAYGPGIDPLDAERVRELHDARRRG